MKFQVAYIGNFRPEFSTESYILRAFTQLGWHVITLQEDVVSTDDILYASRDSDFLAVTHTHGWQPRWRLGWSMVDVLSQLKADGIPTVAVHL